MHRKNIPSISPAIGAPAVPREIAPIEVDRRHERTKRSSLFAQSLVNLVILGDFLVIVTALCLAWWIRFETPLANIGIPLSPDHNFLSYTGHIIIGAVFMMMALFNFRAYDRGQILSLGKEIQALFHATLVWTVAFLCLSLVLKIEPSISRIYSLTATLCILLLLLPWRWLVTMSIIPSFEGALQRRVLLIGWTKETQQIALAAASGTFPEMEVTGLLNTVQSDTPPSDVRVLGTYQALPRILERNDIEAVIVADKGLEPDELAEIAHICEKEMVDFELIPGCFPCLVSGLSMKHVHGVPVLGVTRLPLHSLLNIFLKRVFDIFGAIIGLILAFPIISIFAILIKKESPGSVFYKQRRVGLNGQHFDMWKLRSMRPDAEVAGKTGWTVADDPRCLKVGRLMRAWNIDEIPQFWNVLKGEMSLVGPRPERPQLIRRFKEEVDHYNARHNVKPGMTGWAQVNGLRGDTDLSERVRFDLYYIENWNLLFDLIVMIRTLFTRKGAC